MTEARLDANLTVLDCVMRVCGYARFSLGCFDRLNWVIGQRVRAVSRTHIDQELPGFEEGTVFLLARGGLVGGRSLSGLGADTGETAC